MPKIVIYTTPTCVYCRMAKAFFDEKKIPFEEKDVALDIKAREEMLSKSQQMGVPVIDVDGRVVIGFNREYLNQLIGLA